MVLQGENGSVGFGKMHRQELTSLKAQLAWLQSQSHAPDEQANPSPGKVDAQATSQQAATAIEPGAVHMPA